MKKTLLFLMCILPFLSNAQFICDFNQNTQITTDAVDNILPHTVSCSNGNTYVAWYAANSDIYSMNLQLFDSDGNKIWTNNLVISTHKTISWVTDYSIIVDNENNCILAFNDYRNSLDLVEQDISVYKISQTGEMLWGNDGITFANNVEDEFYPHLVVTPTNQIIVAWANYNNFISIQKLSPEGTLVWGETPLIIKDDISFARYSNPTILNADDENFFLVWTSETGNFMYPTKNILAQKIDDEANLILTQPIIIYNSGKIPIYVKPTVKNDNANGFYITWYCFVDNVLESFVSHLDKDANLTMPVNGIQLVDNLNFMRVDPTICVDNETNELNIFWKQSDLNQSQNAIYGQKFNETGEKLWDENGIIFYDMSSIGLVNIYAKNWNENTLLIYEDYSIEGSYGVKIQTKLIDNQGNEIWNKIVSDNSSDKLDLDYTEIINNQCVAFWIDKRNTNQQVYMQNILVYNVDLGLDATLTQNQSLTLNAGDNFNSYLWSDQSTEATLNILGSDYSIGNHIINVTTTDICDFEYSDEINIEITQSNSIDLIDNQKTKIYPNPFSNILNIECKNVKNIKIINLIGETIFESNKVSDKNQIDLYNFKSGIYFVELQIENSNYKYKISKL